MNGLLDGIVSYWRMEGSSGGDADETGAYPLSLGGGGSGVGTRAGKINNARDFINQASIPLSNYLYNSSLDLSSFPTFTFSCWFKVDDLSLPNNSEPFVFGKWDASPGNKEYSIFLDDGNGRIRHSVRNGSSFQQIFTSVDVTVGVWYFVVTEYDENSNNYTISLNSEALSNNRDTLLTGLTSNGVAPFSIGGPQSGDGLTNFDGAIDEIGFWSRCLSDAEVALLYNSGNGLAYSNFDGTPYNTRSVKFGNNFIPRGFGGSSALFRIKN